MPRKKVSLQGLSSDAYQLVFRANGSEYQSSGPDFVSALEKIVLPRTIKTKGVLNVQAGVLSTKEILIPPVQIRRLSSSRLYRDIFHKRVLSLLR